MTTRLPSKVRLAQIASCTKSMALPPSHDEIEAMARALLASHEQEPVGHVIQQLRGYENPTYVVQMANDPEDGDEVFSHPAPVPAVHLSPDIEYMAEDTECLAMILDTHNVPKEKDGQELSLWGRVVEFCNQQAPVPAVPMAVAGFNAATAIRACMEEFPESMHDIVEECAQIAENTISINHAAPVPAGADDTRRMDWLVSKTVNVREPLVYGSHDLFWSQTISEDWEEEHKTTLREQIDAAMAAAPKGV